MEARKDVKGLIKALKDSDYWVRSDAVAVLGKIGEPAIEPLIRALKDPDSDIRVGVVKALGDIWDARAIEPLIQAFKEKNGFLRGVKSRLDFWGFF